MTLLPLATQALEDPNARKVLEDAIEETGWSTRANGLLVYAALYPGYLTPEQVPAEWDGEAVREWFRLGFQFAEERKSIGHDFIQAIVSVLSNSEEQGR